MHLLLTTPESIGTVLLEVLKQPPILKSSSLNMRITELLHNGTSVCLTLENGMMWAATGVTLYTALVKLRLALAEPASTQDTE